MIKLSRKKINEMVERSNVSNVQRGHGGSGGGGGGGVSSSWVDEHYISKEFFARLFTINGTDENDDDVVVEPNDLDTDITDIQLMFGAWTEHYLSALGIGSGGSGGGGGGGTILTEPLASINLSCIGSPTGANKVICWDGSRWTYKSVGEGSVSSVAMTVPEGFRVTGSAAHTITTSGTFSLTFGGSVTKNRVLASPGDANGAPSWRELVADDIPDLSGKYVKKTDLDSYKWWGRTLQTRGNTKAVYGDIENAANIKIDNDKKISWKQSGQTNYLSMLTLDTSNNFVVGESMADSGLSTYIRGRRVVFQTGTGSSGNHAASMSDAGLFTVEKLRIGSIVISEDTQNGGLHVENAGIYADNYVSALGAGSGGGSSSTGITMSDVWQAMAYTAPSAGSQQIHVSHLAQALTGYVKTTDLSNYVTLAGTQTITGSKTFSGNVTLSSGTFKAGIGGRFQTVCIECDANGTPTNRTGEINRYNSADLHLQYDSGTGSVTMCRQKFQFSENQGVSTLALGGNMLYLNAGSTAPLTTKAWQVSSDIRLKNKVSDADATAEQIAEAPIFDFTWKKEDGGQVFFGTSAQYWQEVFPNAVKKNGTLSMDYGATALGAAVITARRVVDHEKEIKALRKRIGELETEVKLLKAS